MKVLYRHPGLLHHQLLLRPVEGRGQRKRQPERAGHRPRPPWPVQSHQRRQHRLHGSCQRQQPGPVEHDQPAESRPASHRCQHPSERDAELHLAVLQRTDQRLLQPGEPEQRVEHHFQPAGPEQHQQFSPSGRRPDAADQDRDHDDPGRHDPDDRRFRDPLRPHGDPRPVEIKGITSPSPRGPHRR